MADIDETKRTAAAQDSGNVQQKASASSLDEKQAEAGVTLGKAASTPKPKVDTSARPEDEKKSTMNIEEIDSRELLDVVTRIRHDEWRLIQICATKVADNTYEILYTFGRAYDWKNIRITVHGEDKISSITSIYEVAYLYENEIHDLFGIEIDMMNYDFGGKLFRTGMPTPFK